MRLAKLVFYHFVAKEPFYEFSKTQNDAELQLGALARRKQLIIEELERCEKRAAEAIGNF